MNKKGKPITQSLGFYCFACTILTGVSSGVNNVFLGLFIIDNYF